MVGAREFPLDTGVFQPIRKRAAELVRQWALARAALVIVDVAGRTGYYLSGLLDALRPLRRLKSERLTYAATVNRQQAAAIVSMGPSAHHRAPDEVTARTQQLSAETAVTVAVTVAISR